MPTTPISPESPAVIRTVETVRKNLWLVEYNASFRGAPGNEEFTRDVRHKSYVATVDDTLGAVRVALRVQMLSEQHGWVADVDIAIARADWLGSVIGYAHE